jgi:signal transduction histidine kinase
MTGTGGFLGGQNRIGRRLIVLTIAFSSVLTLCISAIQLVLEYRELRSDLDRQMEQFAIYVPGISGSVWAFDEKQIGLTIDALTRLPGIVQVAVATPGGDRHWAAGAAVTEHVAIRTYPLQHEVGGVATKIGILTVTASLDGIYRRVMTHAVSIVLSNGLKTFLVAIFMFVVFRRLVTQRLEALAHDIGRLVPQVEPAGISAAERPAHLDELDSLRWALAGTGRQLGVALDELRQINDELEARVVERTAQLESANSELKAFAYTLSHDLRAPLRSIGSFGHILEEDYAARLDAPGREHLARITAAVRRMDTLIEDTLGLFQVAAATMSVQTVALGRMARDIAGELAAAVPGRSVEWVIDETLTAMADPGLLRTVMENLIGNAWKYSSKVATARIEVAAVAGEGGRTVYLVRDNGAGFDMQYAARLFEPFQRLHSELEFPGTGVGLATMQKIVRRHGGNIWADAQPGRGATFYFTLGA